MIWFKKCFALLLLFPICASALSIKDRLDTATPGAYIVTEQGRNTSVLHFHSKNDHTLLFEEITVPSFICDTIPFNWKEWLQKGAPGNTSWVLYTLDLKDSRISSCYSVTSHSFLSTDALNDFFYVLCHLPLKSVSQSERIAHSASPKPGEVTKPLAWSPPKTFEGKRELQGSFDLFEAKWPKDKTPLSNETIFAYFDTTRPHFPFPLWVQAGKGAVKVKMKTIDAGTGMASPARLPTLPKAIK